MLVANLENFRTNLSREYYSWGAVVDGMLDKTLASEFRSQGRNPAAKPMC